MKIGVINKNEKIFLTAFYEGNLVSLPDALEELGEKRINEMGAFIRAWHSDIVHLNERIYKLYKAGKTSFYTWPAANAEFFPPMPQNPKILTGRGNSAVFVRSIRGALCKQPVLEQRYNFNYTGHNSTFCLDPTYKGAGGWNYEMVMVIGKTAKNVRKEDAYDYIFGYTSMIDIGIHKEGYPFDVGGIWSMPAEDKVFSDYAYEGCFNGNVSAPIPLGPFIVTKDEAGDPHNQILTERESGMLISHGMTDAVYFTFPETLAYLSSFMTLDPGDMVDSASITYDGYPFQDSYDEGSFIEGGTTNIDAVRLYLDDKRRERSQS